MEILAVSLIGLVIYSFFRKAKKPAANRRTKEEY